MDRLDPEAAAISTTGISRVVDQLYRIHEAFDRASKAAEVAASLGKPTADWDDHPLESILDSWLRPQLAPHLEPPVIRELMLQPDDERSRIRQGDTVSAFVSDPDRGSWEVRLMTALKATALCSARTTLTSRAVA
ncbi:hypothetical protein KQY30_02595 [Streptomyces sp. GMY02]|uniref:hypothetical protein n=1 Tax=Streptomyces sp. GMY02 TaxID=1333528 RepID=UPI001C2BC142|nr:hypothetical protein [Streptomyces sp. GMY02]QXE33349.1 hypothetical protein KQY30_02595 [Streptomyces sp. GMY02]